MSAVIAVLVVAAHGAERSVPPPLGDGEDWEHALQVVANLKQRPPDLPVVLLLGDSITRESISTERDLTRQIRKHGTRVVAYNLGSSLQTYGQNILLIERLPPLSGIALIGVDVVRFQADRQEAPLTLPSPSPLPGDYYPHKYTESATLSDDEKRAETREWMNKGYRDFVEHYSYNLGLLRRLVEITAGKGLQPVLVEAPLNLQLVKDVWNEPVGRYRADAKRLAGELGIPTIDLNERAGLTDADFHDMFHLVEPGREKWQQHLAREVARLVERGDAGR